LERTSGLDIRDASETECEDEEIAAVTRRRKKPQRRTTSIVKVINFCTSLELEKKITLFEELGMTDPMRISETVPKALKYVN
jgi:hypothetical protein